MMDIKIKGLKEVERTFDSIEKNVKRLEGERKMPVSDLLTPSFMQKHTTFKSFEEMLDKCSFKIENEEDFKNLNDEGWDEYVKQTTKFTSWDEMLGKATEEYTLKQIFKEV